MDRPLALITGASSGIGEEFARAFAARGHDLVLVARRQLELDALAKQLRQTHGIDAHVVIADLSKPSSVDDLAVAVEGLKRPLQVLVNNAGFGSYGAFVDQELGRELQMIDLNVRALVALTGHFLPSMIARGRGTIVQIASTTSFQPVPYMAVYGATKAFVLSFGEAVAQECQGTGVRVLTVCPGHTPTGFQKRSGVDKRPMRTPAQSAADVVRETMDSLDRGIDHVLVTGASNKITTQLPRLVPRRVVTWAVARAFRPRTTG